MNNESWVLSGSLKENKNSDADYYNLSLRNFLRVCRNFAQNKARVTLCDWSDRFFCIHARSLCEFQSGDK